MDYKAILENLIYDINDEASIEKILLKAQTLAFALGDDSFKEFIKHEQNGYPTTSNIPEYRILNTNVKAKVRSAFSLNSNIVEVHRELVQEKQIESLMFNAQIRHSLREIEHLSQKEGDLYIHLPVYAYDFVKEQYQNISGVEDVWQEIPNYMFLGIISKFKSTLLDLLLRFNRDLNWNVDLASSDNKKRITQIINIHSAITNIGEGNVNAGDIHVGEENS